MDWTNIKTELERILRIEIQKIVMPRAEWDQLRRESKIAVNDRLTTNNESILYYLECEGDRIHLFSVERKAISQKETDLITFLLSNIYEPIRKENMDSLNNENEWKEVRKWLMSQIEQSSSAANDHSVQMPHDMILMHSLDQIKIPFLLYGRSSYYNDSYQVLKKLLETFIDDTVVLIPLEQNEWLILAPDTVLQESGGELQGQDRYLNENVLADFASGLYEMLASEWVGECQLAVDYPIVPKNEVFETLFNMREIVKIGRMLQRTPLFLPWKMKFEKLLAALSEDECEQFLQDMFHSKSPDQEIRATLEQFFALSCNVSETAKQLYIHRNTLLYRFDKFKQESGYDVRIFDQAVLVKAALMLYKMTKNR